MSTYKVRFFRALTGEKGDVSAVNFNPPVKASGLSYDEAVSLKAELETWAVVATEFFVVPDALDAAIGGIE